MGYKNLLLFVFGVTMVNIVGAALKKDRPCAASGLPGKVVCVCNATYCDEITRDHPPDSHYVSYTTSKNGLRFHKDTGILQQGTTDTSRAITVLEIDLGRVDQVIDGFGGSITDAAGLNWKSLRNPALKKYLIESYFSSIGIEYNLLRVPIGGADFSTRKYALNERPLYDTTLSNFTLAPEDYAYKFPMYEEARAVATSELRVVASCWSPPNWMKNANEFSPCGTLKPEYYDTYANYHLKFIELYETEGIPIWAITTTNEPTNYLYAGYFNCLQWSAYDMGNFIENYLGPTIRTSKHNNTKIFALDDLRNTIASIFIEGTRSYPGMLKYVDGLALHSYGDDGTPVSIFNLVRVPYPNLTLLITEYCEGFRNSDTPKVDLGSWDRAVSYMKRYFENLNSGNSGFIDWNLCLDKNGGPNWTLNLVDAPVIVFPEKEQFVKQPMFYAIGHFSKFIPRGSKRVSLKVTPALGHKFLSTAFVTPRNTVVIVLYNALNDTSAALRLRDQVAVIKTPSESIVTVEIPIPKKKTKIRSGNITLDVRRNQPIKSPNKSINRNPFNKPSNVSKCR